jgi:uncharacterized Zn finger protein
MKPIKSFLTEEQIEKLASRSNFRYGKSMADSGVVITSKNNFNIEAKVKHGTGEGRTVELSSTSKGFRWKCTCTSRKDLFCQHCVAVALNSLKT